MSVIIQYILMSFLFFHYFGLYQTLFSKQQNYSSVMIVIQNCEINKDIKRRLSLYTAIVEQIKMILIEHKMFRKHSVINNHEA